MPGWYTRAVVTRGAVMSTTHLILIRHGQIQANLDKRWHGWTDSALTDMGITQAERVAELGCLPQAFVLGGVQLSPRRQTAKPG